VVDHPLTVRPSERLWKSAADGLADLGANRRARCAQATFGALLPGVYQAIASGVRAPSVEVRRGERQAVTLELALGRIEVRVIDSSGAPIVDAMVYAADDDPQTDGYAGQGRTDPRGFTDRLAAALADPALCIAMFEPPPTGRPVWGRREPVTGETVRLAELARPEPTTSWVSFVLVDARGRPFGGTSVATRHPDGTRRSVALDGAGKVTVPGLTRGDRLRVELPDASTLRWPSATSAIAPAVPGEIETRSAPGRIVALGGTERHHRIVLARQSPGFSG